MTVNPEEIPDTHVPTAAELAGYVKWMREQNKWTQATLAEIARLTERTVQRVENGEPSSLDTNELSQEPSKFQIFAFDKPSFPNFEKVELDRTTVLVPLIRIPDGRALRTMVEGVETGRVGRNFIRSA